VFVFVGGVVIVVVNPDVGVSLGALPSPIEMCFCLDGLTNEITSPSLKKKKKKKNLKNDQKKKNVQKFFFLPLT
jgi:hypothetical protein